MAARRQLVRIECCPRYHIREGNLATQAVGHTHHRCFRHLRLFAEKFFDLAWIDIESARDDQVASPPNQCMVTVRRPDREVARAEPTVCERFTRGLCLVPIAGENIRPTQVDLARFSIPDRAPLEIEEPDGYARQWKSNRTGTPFSGVWIAKVHERLAHTIAFQNPVPE